MTTTVTVREKGGVRAGGPGGMTRGHVHAPQLHLRVENLAMLRQLLLRLKNPAKQTLLIHFSARAGGASRRNATCKAERSIIQFVELKSVLETIFIK